MDKIVSSLERLLPLVENTPIVIGIHQAGFPVAEVVQTYWEGREAVRQALFYFRRCVVILALQDTPSRVDQEA